MFQEVIVGSIAKYASNTEGNPKNLMEVSFLEVASQGDELELFFQENIVYYKIPYNNAQEKYFLELQNSFIYYPHLWNR